MKTQDLRLTAASRLRTRIWFLAIWVLTTATLVPLAAASEKTVEVTTDYSNAGDDDMGSNELQGGKTLADDSITLLSESDSVGGENLNAGYSVEAGASGSVDLGKNGVQAKAEIGLEAELNALAQGSLGDENFGVGGAAEAKVNALLKAEGTVGAYIDEHGLTIGLDAKAEAMVSIEASLSFSLTLFGVQTTVTATARGQAGASANATALVTIGFDGKVHFKVGAGATAGLGGGVYFDVAVDAGQLMQNLGFESLDQLIEWAEGVASDPERLAGELASGATGQLGSLMFDAARNMAEDAFSLAGAVVNSLSGLPGGLFGGGSGGGSGGSSPGGGSIGGGAPGGGGGENGQEYKRFQRFEDWSTSLWGERQGRLAA